MLLFIKRILPFLLFSFTFCNEIDYAFAYFPSPSDWRDQTFYMIMIDRFNNGDTTNDNYNGNSNPSNGNGVHGGDLKGITQKLDYIKALGVTAIWLSPVPTNDGDYHGYAAVNWKQVDPRIGTMEDLQHLIQEAHARGIYVFLDIVCNHMGFRIKTPSNKWNYPDGYPLSWKDNAKKYYPPPFDDLNSFHNYGNVSNHNDTAQVKLGALHGLNDMKTEDKVIQDALIDIYEWWIQETDCDGFRIDTFKHVDIEFWQVFCPAIREYASSLGKKDFLMYGEILSGVDSQCGYFTGTHSGGPYVLKSVLYYPMYYTLNNVFALGQNTKQLDERYSQLTCYDKTTWDYEATFIDNHDRPRFLSSGLAKNDYNKLKLALTFLLTSRGVPIIYYGTEQGFYGEREKDACREDMFAGQYKDPMFVGQDSFNTNSPLFQFTSTLVYLRNNYVPLRQGTFIPRWNNSTTAGIYAYSRIYQGQEIIIIINTSTTAQTTRTGNKGLLTTFPRNTGLHNLVDTKDTIIVGGNGVGHNQISVSLLPQSFKILTAIPNRILKY